MTTKYLPRVSQEAIDNFLATDDKTGLFELLVEPLHEELYRRQDFDFMDELSEGQQLFLAYDYLRTQVLQGGFLQFVVNGYVGLLPDLPAWLEQMEAKDMAIVIDDVLRVYVLNIELLGKETTTREFAKLYEEMKEFEILDERFNALHEETMAILTSYAVAHMEEFAVVGES